ncbi:MAG TPA: glycosyltransferase family 2 protein [Candidatus Saccharimonadales bacterium]|nr:glycosyltransferase family 2 protein [Candidatus Saccharimonadales bacterium]
MKPVYVVIPNWNGADRIRACLGSLKGQSRAHQVVVVENGSTDNSAEIIEKEYPDTILIRHDRNKGFAGGVNAGIKYAIEQNGEYVALLNNDAVADKDWLKRLVDFLDGNPQAGIATCKILESGGREIDSTGETYTIWGLPFARGRGQEDKGQFDNSDLVFGASGGASLYRIKMLKEIGLFDEDFFAYYEDVDISFRAQLSGWKVAYVPQAIVYHQIGATSSAIKGFTTYQTLKNLPLLLWKNVPWALMPKVWPRLVMAYGGILLSALRRGQFGPVLKATIVGTVLWPKKLVQRHKIQKNRKVPVSYIASIITHDLPPNADKLRGLRSKWWKLRGKNV